MVDMKKKKAFALARGAVAGAVATMAMKKVTSLLESKKKIRAQDAFRERKLAEREIIDRLNKRYKWKMSRPKRAVAARGLRWGIGIGTGAVGSYVARRVGAESSPWRAAILSALTFMVFDELIKPAVGVQTSPRQVPLQTHAAALAGHATYGLVHAGTGQALQRVMPT